MASADKGLLGIPFLKVVIQIRMNAMFIRMCLRRPKKECLLPLLVDAHHLGVLTVTIERHTY